ncbi:MAG: NADH-quinone oxidoreductase subunit N [Desulfobacteraceae bacterium]|nr:NADH-quinone oxidoreductase subunit N [Desulfobacteraceae bacterium]MDH3573034.1 NADH-quinone oxidoreductase subunit N [Desulfobacteraceae bacterium]MDH3722437.1 NADH-quinone oxidoreductase subunit N [Desulfobacteraceae bacterium]MDH3838158.1 NADH-quinone oxidoreductase subunit N [Desulfobacteraceae bacterium]MDH3872640.1 NADH-quinone oxidoreductase subunit N [Desulfobacteraceae bacterium]
MTLFLPELTLIFMALVFFFASLANLKETRLQALGLLFSAIAVLVSVSSYGMEGSLFFNAYRVDAFSQMFKVIITFGLFIVIYLGKGLYGIDNTLRPEYYLFMTLSAFGLMCMSSAVELITIILSLEIHSFALFIMIPFRKHGAYRKQMEAGIKYALFGAAASGISLYGMSYIFGMTHTTYLADLVKIIPGVIFDKPLMLIGLVMLLCGFFYKLALFPMHFWAPDVYEGAANETSGFVATLPKIGAVALLIRLISLAGADAGQFTWVLMVFAVLSMTFGNLSALVQNDIKRLLAYSSIAHAGYVMIGLLCATDFGYLSGIYYIAGYLLMNLACFYVIYNLAPKGENITFDDLGGLYKRSPLLALTLAVGAFGLAGIPPTIGFTGKLFLFTAAIKKDMYALVILAVINSGLGIFYYLKMVRAAYTGVDAQVSPLNLRLSTAVLGIFFIVIIILLGTFPQGFMDVAKEAVAAVI